MARLDIYTSMAHFVGKTLHIRPNEILDTWGVPELVVAFGYYSDEISMSNYETWKSYDSQTRNKVKMPDKFNVKFISPQEEHDGQE